METRLDRPDRPAQSFRNSFERKIRPEAEDDHDPLVCGQYAEACEQGIPFDERHERVTPGELRAAVDRDEADDVPTPESIAAAVDEDPVEPRTESVRLPQHVERLPGNDEGVLDGVLGLVSVGEKESSQSINPIESRPGARQEVRSAVIGGGRRGVGGMEVHWQG